MGQKSRIWIQNILGGAIPALLIYIGKFDRVWIHLKGSTTWDFTTAQLSCFVVGTIWASVILPRQLALAKLRLEDFRARDEAKNRNIRDAALNLVRSDTGMTGLSLRVRYFRHRQSRWNKVLPKKYRKEFLELTDIPGITDEFPYSLSLEVVPEPEGVVGMAFAEGKILSIWNLSNETAYNIRGSGRKLPVLCNVKACFGCPVRTIRPKPLRTIGVLSVDCDEEIQLDQEKQRKFNTFVATLGEYVEKQVLS